MSYNRLNRILHYKKHISYCLVGNKVIMFYKTPYKFKRKNTFVYRPTILRTNDEPTIRPSSMLDMLYVICRAGQRSRSMIFDLWQGRDQDLDLLENDLDLILILAISKFWSWSCDFRKLDLDLNLDPPLLILIFSKILIFWFG